MALGTHPAFLASAVWPDMEATGGKAAGKPVSSLTPVIVYVDFTMQAQTQSNWCWAAAATSTSRYYIPTSQWMQCTVANAALPRTDCCPNPVSNPVPTPCNVPFYLETALGVTGNFVSMTGPISDAAIIAELEAGRPIAARVQWEGGGGHAVVIAEYQDLMGEQKVGVADPFYGYEFNFISSFRYGGYQGSGTWTHTYFTQAPAP